MRGTLQVDQRKLDERLSRVRSFQRKYPGSGRTDAINAVLNTDYRGKLTEGMKRERYAYARALRRELNQQIA